MTQLAIPRLLFTATSVLAACTVATPEPPDEPGSQAVTASSSAEAVTQDTLLATSHCMLLYYSDQCPGGVCPSLGVARLDQPDGGAYPAFFAQLGTADLPYTGTAAAAAKWVDTGPLVDDGYFDLSLRDRDGARLDVSSEAEVLLARLATDRSVHAGDLRAKVPSFVHQGQVFNQLELLCYVTPN